MTRACLVLTSMIVFSAVICGGAVLAENEGLPDLEKAAEVKLSIEGPGDLNEAIELLESALEKGLDEEHAQFAEQMLAASLLQRGQSRAAAILRRPVPDPRKDPRWIQIRSVALTDLQRAVEFDDTQWEAYMLIGRLQMLPYGDPAAARLALTKSIKSEEISEEQRAELYALRGAAQSEEEGRLADFIRAIELRPDNADLLRIRAQIYIGQKQYELALEDIDRALKLEPDDSASYEVRGLILIGLDRLDDAIDSFDRATELAPEAALPYQHRGEVYRRRGDLQSALQQLTKALDLAPGNVAALVIRATVYAEADDFDKALEDLNEVLRRQPNLLRAHLLRIEVLERSGRTSEAIDQMEMLMRAIPKQNTLSTQLAVLYLQDDRPRQAIERLNDVIERDPKNYVAVRTRGDAHLTIGNHAQAIEDFEVALKLKGDDPGLLNNFAWVLATSPDDELRDGARAVELAAKGCELTEYQTPHILSTLAAAYAETGDFESAVKWSTKAVELSSTGKDNEQLQQLTEELTSYQEEKPWRERQRPPDSEVAGTSPDEQPLPEAADAEADDSEAPPLVPEIDDADPELEGLPVDVDQTIPF